jgi:hypothetical protein
MEGQKRASLLFSDLSQSIASALAPPLPAESPPTTASKTTSEPCSILDEDDEDDEDNTAKLGTVMKPETTLRLPTPTIQNREGETSNKVHGGDDDDDWNW